MIDAAIVFTRPEDDQRLWLGFSYFKNFSHIAAEAIQESLNRADKNQEGVSAAQLIGNVIYYLTTEVDLSYSGKFGITFDYPPNIRHSIFDFNLAEGTVTLYDSEYDEVKTSWSIHEFLDRIN